MLALFFFAMGLAWAQPQQLEVWFLTTASHQKTSEVLDAPALSKRILLAGDCEAVGDYCLDPQKGLIRKSVYQLPELQQPQEPYQELPQLPAASSIDRQLVNCDQSYAFDLFCGQAQKEGNTTSDGFEIWIDTSSSMRSVDGANDCYRKKFLQGVREGCGKKPPRLMGFDVEKREISIEQSCVNKGLNDIKKVMQWLEDSKAKYVLLITDVYEYQAEFAQFLEKHHAKIKGDRGHFPAVEVLNYISDVAKQCE